MYYDSIHSIHYSSMGNIVLYAMLNYDLKLTKNLQM